MTMRKVGIAIAALLIALAVMPVIRFPGISKCPFVSDSNYDPWDEIKDNDLYLQHALEFAGMRSTCEVQELKARLDQDERDKRTLAAAGALGTFAWLLARLLNPFVWIAAFILYAPARAFLVRDAEQNTPTDSA
jgi:hypothetical protein